MGGEFEALLQEYQLQASHEADLGDDCITIDVSLEEDKKASGRTNSLEHMNHQVAALLRNDVGQDQSQCIESASKLYIVGIWTCKFPINCEEWTIGVETACGLIKKMQNLKELTWVSELPFMTKVWDVLPKSVSKLVVDISHPIIVSPDSHRAMHIPPDDMKPLISLTKLRELRIFGMRDSCQCIIWETVFRNEAEDKGMHVLDLRMAGAPLVRNDHWVKAKDVEGLKVINHDDVVYKGIDGKGVLHHVHGTGEYLDDYCMRKARIASGLDERKPLPLSCLKLDGFVIDQLPLEHELNRVVLLTCGQNCIDAGLRAPRTPQTATQNKWGSSIHSNATHCFIVWPNWRAIFNNDGQLLDPDGNVVTDSSDEVILTPPESMYDDSPDDKVAIDSSDSNVVIESPDSNDGIDSPDEANFTPNTSEPPHLPDVPTLVPLTEGNLDLKELEQAIDDRVVQDRHLNGSTVSERGSTVPGPSVQSDGPKGSPASERECVISVKSEVEGGSDEQL